MLGDLAMDKKTQVRLNKYFKAHSVDPRRFSAALTADDAQERSESLAVLADLIAQEESRLSSVREKTKAGKERIASVRGQLEHSRQEATNALAAAQAQCASAVALCKEKVEEGQQSSRKLQAATGLHHAYKALELYCRVMQKAHLLSAKVVTLLEEDEKLYKTWRKQKKSGGGAGKERREGEAARGQDPQDATYLRETEGIYLQLEESITQMVVIDNALAKLCQLRRVNQAKAAKEEAESSANESDEELESIEAPAKAQTLHLAVAVADFVAKVREIVTERLQRRLAGALAAIRWPVPMFRLEVSLRELKVVTEGDGKVGGAEEVPAMPEGRVVEQADSRMVPVYTWLLYAMRLQRAMEPEVMAKIGSVARGKESVGEPLWAMEQLLTPIRERFLYNFMGETQTNQLEKPEWYLQHSLGQIRDHAEFMVVHVQPLLDCMGLAATDAVQELGLGVLALVRSKLAVDIPVMLETRQELYCHTLMECCAFDSSLEDVMDQSTSHLPNAVQAFAETDSLLEQWLTMEYAGGEEKFSAIARSKAAWELQYATMPDVDPVRHPVIAEAVIEQVAALTERYRGLAHAYQRLSFYTEVQEQILVAFHNEVEEQLEALGSISKSSDLKKACVLCNALQYATLVLKHWGEDAFFLTLQYEREKADDASLQLIDVEGTIFDDVIRLYTLLGETIMSTIVESVVQSFKYSSLGYFSQRDRREGIFLAMGQLSPQFEHTLIGLRGALKVLAGCLAPGLLPVLGRRLAVELDGAVEDALMQQTKRRGAVQFSQAGGKQLENDLQVLYDLFDASSPSVCLALPSSIFVKAVTCAKLLAMDVRDIKEMLSDMEYQSLVKQRAICVQYGIATLTPKEAKALLALRTDVQLSPQDDDLL